MYESERKWKERGIVYSHCYVSVRNVAFVTHSSEWERLYQRRRMAHAFHVTVVIHFKVFVNYVTKAALANQRFSPWSNPSSGHWNEGWCNIQWFQIRSNTGNSYITEL
jgi:hypothetical protein